jgi:hypothetical protein
VWKSYPRSPRAARAGLRAAEIAERTLHDSSRARDLYRDLAARSEDAEVRRQAESALERLRHAQS